MAAKNGIGAVSVGKSEFGLGVFAARSFRARQRIAHIRGKHFDDPEYGSDYCIGIGEAALEPYPPFRFLNHCCRPNCELLEIEFEDEQGERTSELWLEACTTIRPGEELTIDYAWPAEVAIPCGCGDPECRGWIVAAEELPQLRRRKRPSVCNPCQ